MADVNLAEVTRTLWQEQRLLDYTIEVGDKEFKVHKVVMTAASDYFKAMLTGGMADGDRARLHELKSDIVYNMIEFIYTGQFGSTEATTEELLACAVSLQIPAAIEECTKLLVSKVDKLNCFDILSTFKTHNVESGVKPITKFIKANIDDLMQGCPVEMSFNGFRCFMDFWQKSEWKLMECILNWINADMNVRVPHWNELIGHVRFALMTPGQFQAVQQQALIESWPCRHLIDAAEAFHSLPTHRKVLDESVQSRMRSDPVAVCYTTGDMSSSVFYSLRNEKSWKKHTARYAPNLYEGIAAHITVNNYLIVCDSLYSEEQDALLIQSWHIFDPRTSTWSTMAPMRVSRDEFALVHHKKHLYALGGCKYVLPPLDEVIHSYQDIKTLTDVIERYDFESNVWEVIHSKLPIALEKHSAGVIGDCIYVVGGCSSVDSPSVPSRLSSRHDCLDLSTNTWQSRATSPVTSTTFKLNNEIKVMKLWDEEVLFLITDEFEMHYYSPSADQWSTWDCLADVDSDIVRWYEPVVIVDENTLFLHSFAYTVKENTTDSYGEYEQTACVKWTVGRQGEKISEVRLKDYPIRVGSRSYLTTLLSVRQK